MSLKEKVIDMLLDSKLAGESAREVLRMVEYVKEFGNPKNDFKKVVNHRKKSVKSLSAKARLLINKAMQNKRNLTQKGHLREKVIVSLARKCKLSRQVISQIKWGMTKK